MILFTTRYLKGVKSGITYVISHNYVKIKVDSQESFPLEKTLVFNNVIILIIHFNKSKNYCYSIFLEICFYQLPNDVNKTNESKEWFISHCWYFLDKGFYFNQIYINDVYEP